MQKTGEINKCKQDIQHDKRNMDVRHDKRKMKQKYWWVLTESVLAGIAWNG